MSTTSTTRQRVVIAIDPHKASWTAAVVDASLQPWQLFDVRHAGGRPGRTLGATPISSAASSNPAH